MPQQIGDPGAIVGVSLAPGNRLDVLWVHQHLLELPFLHGPHRFPIDPGRLRRQMVDPVLLQPIRHLQQVGCEGREGPRMLLDSSALADTDAGTNRLLVTSSPWPTGSRNLAWLPSWTGSGGSP
jgi:hypothetical protein